MSNGERRKEPLQHRVQPLLQFLRHPLVSCGSIKWLLFRRTYSLSTTGRPHFNIQPRGMQNWLESVVASGLPMEEARAVQGSH